MDQKGVHGKGGLDNPSRVLAATSGTAVSNTMRKSGAALSNHRTLHKAYIVHTFQPFVILRTNPVITQ